MAVLITDISNQALMQLTAQAWTLQRARAPLRSAAGHGLLCIVAATSRSRARRPPLIWADPPHLAHPPLLRAWEWHHITPHVQPEEPGRI